jgi:hypothetical protein
MKKKRTFWQKWAPKLDSLDLFSEPVPQLNFKGRSSNYSCCGLFITLIMVTLVLMFAGVKFVEIVTGSEPNITIYETQIKPIKLMEKSMDLYKHDLRYAVGMEVVYNRGNKYLPERSLTDEDPVEWMVEIFKVEDYDHVDQ